MNMSSNRVEVVDYDHTWPEQFEQIRENLLRALTGVPVRVEHVGSTAVPGLAAKPIIDADVVVESPEDIATATGLLAAIGYRPEGDLGIAGREAFAPPPKLPDHHLYLVVDGSPAHRDHVDLRDYLRSHPTDAERYATRKRELADTHVTDREAYTAAKGHMIQELLAIARSEE